MGSTPPKSDPRLARLSPTLKRYYDLLLEHMTKTPTGKALVRMPGQTLKVRAHDLKNLFEAHDALEQLCKQKVIEGEYPWLAISLPLESTASVVPEPAAPKKIPPTLRLPAIVRQAPTTAPRPVPPRTPPTPRPQPVTKPAIARAPAVPARPVAPAVVQPQIMPTPAVAAASRDTPIAKTRTKKPAKRPVRTKPETRVQRQKRTACHEDGCSSLTVGQYISEITRRIAIIKSAEFGDLPARAIFDMVAKTKRISLDDLCDLIEKYKRKQ